MDTMMEINNLSIKDSNAMSHDLHLLTSRIAEKLKYMSAKYDSQGDRIESELSALLESTNPKSKLLDMMDMRKVFGL
jgi:hypothetical protein